MGDDVSSDRVVLQQAVALLGRPLPHGLGARGVEAHDVVAVGAAPRIRMSRSREQLVLPDNA